MPTTNLPLTHFARLALQLTQSQISDIHATATTTAAAAEAAAPIARSRNRFAISVQLAPLIAYTILWSSQATHSIIICIHVQFFPNNTHSH